MADEKTIHNQTPDNYVGQPSGLPRQLPSGYVGQSVPTDFDIPSCGIEDVDKALFKLFDETIGFVVESQGTQQTAKTIFASGERFALVQRRKPIRDKDGAYILPLVSIRRTSIDQKQWSLSRDIGDLIIKTRLSERDPRYQSIINKTGLTNQDNLNTVENFLDRDSQTGAQPGRFVSRRSAVTRSGPPGTLAPDIGNNIFEFITIPFPQFFTAHYEIVFWTQYTQHMNQMLERFMNSYHAQGTQFKLGTDKGYWFVGYVNEELSPADNFNDYSDQERIIKYSFTMDVPGYIVAPRNPGEMSPFRRYVSAPQIHFGIRDVNAQVFIKTPTGAGTGDEQKFILDEVNTLDRDGEQTDSKRESIPYKIEKIEDPFSGESKYRTVRIVARNERVGETVGRFEDMTIFDDA